MNRDFWTVYDDDTMEYPEPLTEVEHERIVFQFGDLSPVIAEIMEQYGIDIGARRKVVREDKDHFEQEDDLFEI